MSIERRRVTYQGQVQGVGFRVTTCRLSAEHAVSGFVRNLSDGRVRLEVQGDREVVARFLAAVAEAFEPSIDHVSEESVPLDQESPSTGFRIAYSAEG